MISPIFGISIWKVVQIAVLILIGMYLVFAWPSVFGTPSFVVNGLLSTAFTKVRGVSNLNSFTNELGFTSNYDVWVSNTAQNSPLTIIIS